MSEKQPEPYFAPPAEGDPPQGEVPSWGEDATQIAREAGLGSYGADPSDREARAEAMLGSLEDAEREAFPSRHVTELASLKRTVQILGLCVCALGVAVGLLAMLILW